MPEPDRYRPAHRYAGGVALSAKVVLMRDPSANFAGQIVAEILQIVGYQIGVGERAGHPKQWAAPGRRGSLESDSTRSAKDSVSWLAEYAHDECDPMRGELLDQSRSPVTEFPVGDLLLSGRRTFDQIG